MSDSPPGWQYPQVPSYPQGPVTPGAAAALPRPPALQQAVILMYVGAALALIAGIVGGLTTKTGLFNYSDASTTTTHTASYVIGGIAGGIIIALLWLWMAWKTWAGRGWARVLSTVFFGLFCVELLGEIASAAHAHAYSNLIVVLIEWGVALAALIQLWQRDSSNFFAYANQAKLARAYGGYQGYMPPPYDQPPPSDQ